MTSKIVRKIIMYELAIWKTAYPNHAKILDKFANKIIYELQEQVNDGIRAGGKE